ncbi:uncharacterized protein LOC107806464 isoform X2 [Nicotiana tabacum]|uniref:Uncharacterized protein LOC107806464 isoform X2 n=1 Tax=Nicotiana tabacum TaxID=4097 RepID=A0A1S4BBA7_TOBAC|nr:PREDICTED: uncharacterized protein LOC107806464 [Nicotiana tabacum]
MGLAAQRNVPSLVSAILHIHVDCEYEDYNLEKEYSNLKELLQTVAHVENLELSPWFIQYVYKNDKRCKRFEIHDFNCSLVHLKTIKFINMVGPLSENKFVLPLIKYLLENAIVLEKLSLLADAKGVMCLGIMLKWNRNS